jgi:NTE family protein
MELVRGRRAHRLFCCLDLNGDGGAARFAAGLAGALAAVVERAVAVLDLTAGGGAWVVRRDGTREALPGAPGLAALSRSHAYVVAAVDPRTAEADARATVRACERTLTVLRDAADLAAWQRSPERLGHALVIPPGLPRIDRERDVHRWPATGGPADERLALARIARRETGMSVGLVLGGGAARAFAHFGVLRVLEQAGVPIDLLGGTSGGGYVAAFHASGRSVDEAYAICVKETVDRNPLSDIRLPLTALTGGKTVQRAVDRAFGRLLIEDLAVDFFVVATDLVTAAPVILDHGPLGEACRASAAIPGIFPPIRRGGALLVDGGLMQNVPGPVMKARGADLAIVVDLSSERAVNFDLHAPKLIPILMRSLEVLMANSVRNQAWSFDVHIRPPVHEFGMLDWKDHRALVERGRMAAEAALPALLHEIATRRARVQDELDRALAADPLVGRAQ